MLGRWTAVVSMAKHELCGSVEGFVGRAKGTPAVGLQSLQVCPVLCSPLPEVDVGLLAGGGQGISPTVLGWAEEGEPAACRSLWFPLGSSRILCGKVTLQGMWLLIINS